MQTQKQIKQEPSPVADIRVPMALEAERAILGALILDSGLWSQTAHLQTSDFFLKSHRLIYGAMGTMREDRMTFCPVMLTDRLRQDGNYDQVGGHAYIASLFDGIPLFSKNSDISSYVFLVKERAIQRRLMRLTEKAAADIADGFTESTDVMASLEKELQDLRAAKMNQEVPRLAEGIQDYIDEMLACKESRSPVTFNAGPLDARIVGPSPGDLIIIGARTSQGKTVMALQAAVNTALSNVLDHDPVIAFFSLEMSKEQIKNRALQMICGFPVNKYVIKSFNAGQMQQVRSAGRLLSALQIFAADGKRYTSQMVVGQCHNIKKRTGHLDLVVIDYFGLLESSIRHSSRIVELESITRDLKLSAMELGCPFIVPAQLNREADGTNDPPRLSHLRGCGSIEQDADIVILLHRPGEEQQEADVEDRDVYIAKQRNGWVGGFAGTFDKRNLAILATEEKRRR